MQKPIELFDKIFTDLRPVAYAAGAVSFFINLLILPMSLYALQVMDRVINTGSMATLIWLTLIMLAMFAVAGLLQALRSITLTRAADWAHERMSELALPIVLTQSTGGNRGAQLLRDAASIRNFFSGPGLSTLFDAPWSILYIIVLFIIHPALGVLVTSGAVLLLVLAWFNEAAIREPSKEAAFFQARNMQELELATRNAEATQAMGMGKALTLRWRSVQARVYALQTLGSDRAALIQGFTKFARLSLQVLVTGIAAWLSIDGAVTIGAIVASSILASRALAPFEVAIGSWKTMNDARTAYTQLRDVLTNASALEDPMALPAPEGVLSLEKVSFTPPGRQAPILSNIDLHLQAGETLGIIGASGSGKSTLARLIMGVYTPDNGAARLDGADIYRWPREEFGKYTGYLPQDVELFGGTVRENIARFCDAADPEAIVRAAQLANAHELILRLPQGYDTQIGAGGALLSAGQRQRIGLARAFYGDPRLLVLDEPDASLDDTGQQALIMALRRAKHENMTCVVVTHRKSLLSHVDKLLFLHEGKVMAFGPVAMVMEALAAKQKALQANEGSSA